MSTFHIRPQGLHTGLVTGGLAARLARQEVDLLTSMVGWLCASEAAAAMGCAAIAEYNQTKSETAARSLSGAARKELVGARQLNDRVLL